MWRPERAFVYLRIKLMVMNILFTPSINLSQYTKYTFTLKKGENIKQNLDFLKIPNYPGVYLRYNNNENIPHYIGKAGMKEDGTLKGQGLSGRLTNTRGISKNMIIEGFKVPRGINLYSGGKEVSGNGLYQILMETNNWESMTWEVFVTHNRISGDNCVEIETQLLKDYVSQFGKRPKCNNKG